MSVNRTGSTNTVMDSPDHAGELETVSLATKVLEYLAGMTGLEFDMPLAKDAWMQAVRENPGPQIDAWATRMAQAGKQLGYRISTVRESVGQAANLASVDAPAVTYCELDGSPCWLVLLQRSGGRFQIAILREDESTPKPEVTWVRENQLVKFFGLANKKEALDWVLAHPLMPCADLTVHHEHDGQHEEGHPPALSPLRRLVGLLRSELRDLRLVLLFGIGIGLFTLTTPIAVEALVNTVALGNSQQNLVILTLMVLGCLTVSACMVALQYYVVELMQQRIFVRVTADLAHRLPRVRAQAFDRHHGPELVNRFFEVLTVQKAASVLLLDAMMVVIQTIIGMMLLAIYHPFLLGFDVLILAGMLIIFLGLGRNGVRTSIQESVAKYAVAGWLEEMARHPHAFKLSGGPEFAMERADVLARTYLGERRQHFRIVFRQIAGALALQAIASTVLLGLGGWLVINRSLTLGQLVAAELVITLILSSFAKLGKSLGYYYDLMASMDKLGHLVDLPLEREMGDGMGFSPKGAALRLRNVSFEYDDGKRVLDDLDVSIAPGTRVAITGASGTGKSTLVELLFGLREPTEGHIELDGVDIRELRLEVLRQHVAAVSSAEIFEGTIADNVRMGRHYISLLDVRMALDKVALLEHVMAFPEGLHTQLSTGGRPLTMGQAYRLAMARAIAGRPRLLIIDRGIDQVDPKARDKVISSLFDGRASWTVLVVTNNPDIVKQCYREISFDVPPMNGTGDGHHTGTSVHWYDDSIETD